MQRILTDKLVENIDTSVKIQGWVDARRDHGKLIFFDIRDRTGIAQIVVLPKSDSYAVAESLRSEFVVEIVGRVQKRPDAMVNADIPSGTIEVLADTITILNESKTSPFELADTRNVHEELRLKYRYLDLRTARMRRNMIMRDQITNAFRSFLRDNQFLEIETPNLVKGTPEGAREFVVPSRLHTGKFYVLPQSPQQFKQLLMVGGLERYFQIARCFRDEDQRGDRQPEFTQVDLEMSFVEREDVITLMEQMIIDVVKHSSPEKRIQQVPFPRISYKEAMEKYGTDRPDIREDTNDPNLLAFCWVIDFPFFEKTDDGGWTFTHNPFSRAIPEHQEWLMEKKNLGEILTSQYDIVLNGFEIGGGSIRNHQAPALQRVFEIMGFTEEQIINQFGHMLEAFEYGAPPHGGIAFGLDRFVALLTNEPNIREVIAFPKTGDARDPLMGAPSEVSEKQLKEVAISLTQKNGA